MFKCIKNRINHRKKMQRERKRKDGGDIKAAKKGTVNGTKGEK